MILNTQTHACNTYVRTSAVEGGHVPARTGGSTGAFDRFAGVVITRDGWIARGCAAGAIPSDRELPVPGPSADSDAIMLAGHLTIVLVYNLQGHCANIE